MEKMQVIKRQRLTEGEDFLFFSELGQNRLRATFDVEMIDLIFNIEYF